MAKFFDKVKEKTKGVKDKVINTTKGSKYKTKSSNSGSKREFEEGSAGTGIWRKDDPWQNIIPIIKQWLQK